MRRDSAISETNAEQEYLKLKARLALTDEEMEKSKEFINYRKQYGYLTLKDIAKANHISYSTLMYRMSKKKMTVEQAINYQPQKTLRDVARENNITYQTLWQRLNRDNMTLEEALQKPLKGK